MKPTVFCLTPVKNEERRLHAFLQCASEWADVILLADQQSTDGTRQIARSFAKVEVIANDDRVYDEVSRQRLLFGAARRRLGPKVLFALDADEALTAGLWESESWMQALASPPGTSIRLDWLNLLPGERLYWSKGTPVPFGFVDDGRAHAGSTIHNTRVPLGDRSITITDGGVLHCQYLDWAGMKGKQRWYQAWEVLNIPEKRPAHIFRQYHRMDSISSAEIFEVKPEWITPFHHRGISFLPLTSSVDEWNQRLMELVASHGPALFRRADIWDDISGTEDPRSRIDRFVLWFLRRTQAHGQRRSIRAAVAALRLIGW